MSCHRNGDRFVADLKVTEVQFHQFLFVSNLCGRQIIWLLIDPHFTETKVKVEYDERVNATENSDGVPHAKLMINKLKIKTDRGDYTCKANNSLGEDSEVVSLKVKGNVKYTSTQRTDGNASLIVVM